jgi:hypothetical protein
MRKSIVAALCCLPFAAHAGKIVVEYSGVVSSVDRNWLAEESPYSVGDPISGTLLIDAGRAPTDELALDRQIGRYSGGTALDFILGPKHPGGIGSADLALVHDDWQPSAGAPLEDGVIIKDSAIGIDGASSLLLGLQRPISSGQVFSDDSLSQSFVVEREPGTNLWGFLERGFGEFWQLVSFTVDRLSMTPLTCKP